MKRRLSLFWHSVITLAIVMVIIKLVIPNVSMWITGKPYPLPVPSTLTLMYVLVTLIGLSIFISTSDQNIRSFLDPIVRFLRGGQGGLFPIVRMGVLVIIPLGMGWLTYERTAPKVVSATGIRIQHPTIPKQFSTLENPYRNPTDDMIKQFIQEKGLGNISMDDAKAKFREATLIEGRGLYQAYCRPCHGSKADGNGPMAIGFRLRPADFTDPGTISTVVEGYAFWRVRDGGRGLPKESTPWDSAMPTWKLELTDDEIWKIIMAEYNTAGVEPRLPEKLEGKQEAPAEEKKGVGSSE
jgi:mono/diheme cytochrome c family protein